MILIKFKNGNPKEVKVYKGFSWGVLLTGVFCPLFRGDFIGVFKIFITISIMSFITFFIYGLGGFAALYYCAYSYNKSHYKRMIKKGYKKPI